MHAQADTSDRLLISNLLCRDNFSRPTKPDQTLIFTPVTFWHQYFTVLGFEFRVPNTY